MTTCIVPGVGPNLLGQHAAERNQDSIPRSPARLYWLRSTSLLAGRSSVNFGGSRSTSRAANAGAVNVPLTPKQRSDYDDDEEDEDGDEPENGKVEEVKKVKQKKPKVTVAEAAAKIDAIDLVAFLAEISTSYESQQDIQMMQFADYFGRAFSTVSSSQFPWIKLLRESTVAKMADVS
ncbi:hypothetical protein K1719_023898 [Acacia pycnantha]|nr:hypothetical protein K1719_023898 [Acacia pycnantha]